MSKQPRPPLLGDIVYYHRRDNLDDAANPVSYPPLAAIVLGVCSVGGLNLLVLGEGSEADLARGRRGSLLRSRTGVDHASALEGMERPPARWWDYRPTEGVGGSGRGLDPRLRFQCSCGSLWPLDITHCSTCGAARCAELDLWLRIGEAP